LILPLEAQEAIWEQIGEKPQPMQRKVHEEGGRYVLIGGGERGGKSRTLARHLFDHHFFGELFWIIGPDYEQTHREFQYTLDWLLKLGAVQKGDFYQPKRGSWGVEIKREKGLELWGIPIPEKTQIVTKTAGEVLSLAMEAPDGCLVVEPGQIDSYEVLLRLRGRVAEKRGWIWLGGTFEKAADWYRDIWEEWQGKNVWGGQSFDLPSWGNTIVYPGGRDDPEIKAMEKIYLPELFMERFGGRPYKPSNLVLKEFERGRHVKEVEFDVSKQTEIWVDPGFVSHYAVACVQFAKNERGDESIQIVDTMFEEGKTVYQVIELAKKRRWFPYVKAGIIDVAGKQKQANQSQVEIWQEKTGIALDGQHIEIEDGIQRHRDFLINDRISYAGHCQGLGEYRSWRRNERDNVPERVNCDLMKAIQYGLIARFGFVDQNRRSKYVLRSPFSF
jgi:hypothetical protein